MNFETLARLVLNAAEEDQHETPNYIPRKPMKLENPRKPNTSYDLPHHALDSTIQQKFSGMKSFTDQFSVLLLDSSPKKQFVLKGDPSSGKSTELRKIARQLHAKTTNEKVASRSLVHLCSIQNYTGDGSNINNSDDLWHLIRQSHQSEFLREQEDLCLDDFLKIHQTGNTSAILLIDTLDMLTYGVQTEDMERVSSAWLDLVSRFEEAPHLSVLWAVRPVEYQHLVGKSKPDLVEIELPKLAYLETRQKVGQCLKEYEVDMELEVDRTFFIEILSGFVMLFPVAARFLNANAKPNTAKHDLTLELLNKLDEMFSRTINGDIDFSMDPLEWMLSNSSLFTDCIYDVVRGEIFFSAAQENSYLVEERMEERWRAAFEEPLLSRFHSDDDSKVFSNRFFFGRAGSQDEYKNMFIAIGKTGLRGLGIFQENRYTKRITFIHQLFIEHAVYQAAKHADFPKNLLPKLLQIPTFKLKFYAESGSVMNKLTPAEISLYKNWFYPLFVYNKNLQRHEKKSTDNKQWSNDVGGRNLLKGAHNMLRIIKNSNEKEHLKHMKSLLDLTEDKQEVLDKHGGQISSPLLVNGPAGTGKTYMAGPFIVERVMARKQHQGKTDVSFITLSGNLSKSFDNEFSTNYLEPKEGRTPLAANLNAYSVDELLYEVSVQLEETRKSADDFFQSILTESKFVNWFHGRISTSSLPPPYALWQEFDDFFFKDDGSIRTVLEYCEAVEASTEDEPSLLGITIGAPRNFTRPVFKRNLPIARHFRRRETIAKELIEKIMEELGRNFDEDNESDENDVASARSTNRFEWLLDRVNHLRSDVLIIDEVQDLGYFVLELCLLLHRGEVADVAILGDNEQTLDFVEFDWADEFKRLGAELYERFKNIEVPGWSPDDVFRITRWKEANLSKRVEGGGLEQLKIVQRSTAQIVEFNKNSFNTSVYGFKEKNSGTAIIEAGTKAEEKLAQLEEKGVNVEAGVFWLNEGNPWSEKEVLDKLNTWSTSPNLIAVVFPNEAIESHFQSLCMKNNIDIETWHPVSIKGLEADIVVVFSPWSIEHTKIPWIAPIVAGEKDAWEQIVNAMEMRPSTTDLLKRIAGQRRRHANVMLSRPILTLVIVDLDHQIKTKDKPTELQLIQAQQPDLENLEHEVNRGIPLGLEAEGDDIRKLDNDSLIGQLKWLSSLIDAKKALRQIVSSSARILKLSEKSDISEKSDLIPKVQFRLLPLHVIKEYGGVVMQDRLTAMGGANEDEPIEELETTWFNLMERFLFHKTFRSADGKAYDSIKLGRSNLGPLAKEFVDAQHEFYDLSFLLKTDGEGQNFTVKYSQKLGQRITQAYEEMVDLLARLPNLPEKHTSAISDFVEVSIFPTIHFGETLSSWIQIAKRVQLHSPELKTKPFQEPQNLDNFDKLVRLLCMFRNEWYDFDTDRDSLSKRRGYTKEDLTGQFGKEKYLPYKESHRKSSGREDPAPTQDFTNIEFWKSGREFLIQDTEEFREAITTLEGNFLTPLSKDGSKDAKDEGEVDLSTSPAQIDFLLQLTRRSAELGHGEVIEEFITRLVDLSRFAKYEHMMNRDVSSLSEILPPPLPHHGHETFSRKSFIQHVLDLTEKQFWELESLFLNNAFDIAEVFTEWVLEKTSDRNPLSISMIHQITTLRERLDSIARVADSSDLFDSPDGKLSSLIGTANIDIDWDTEIVAFRPYIADISELTKVINKLKPKIDNSHFTTNFYKHLLPAAQSYQEEFGYLPKAFIQHVLSLHRTWYHLPNTTPRQKRALPGQSYSQYNVFI